VLAHFFREAGNYVVYGQKAATATMSQINKPIVILAILRYSQAIGLKEINP